MAEKNAARKRAMNKGAKHKKHLQKVGAAVNKLEGRVLNVETENKTLSRQLVHEMGRCKSSDAVNKKVQMQLQDVSVGMDNLRGKMRLLLFLCWRQRR